MGRLVLVNNIPSEAVRALLKLLSETRSVTNVFVAPGGMVNVFDLQEGAEVPGSCQVQFKVRPSSLAGIVQELRTAGYDDFDIVDLKATTGSMVQPQSSFPGDNRNSWGGRMVQPMRERQSALEIHAGIVANSYFNFDHGMFIVMASGLAAVGLLTDSEIQILASFFISPLMDMIIAASWGAIIGDRKLFFRGLKNVFLGAFLTWLCGVIVGALLSLYPNEEGLTSTPEGDPDVPFFYYAVSVNTAAISQRGPPASANLLTTVVIGVFSGCAIALVT